MQLLAIGGNCTHSVHCNKRKPSHLHAPLLCFVTDKKKAHRVSQSRTSAGRRFTQLFFELSDKFLDHFNVAVSASPIVGFTENMVSNPV